MVSGIDYHKENFLVVVCSIWINVIEFASTRIVKLCFTPIKRALGIFFMFLFANHKQKFSDLLQNVILVFIVTESLHAFVL